MDAELNEQGCTNLKDALLAGSFNLATVQLDIIILLQARKLVLKVENKWLVARVVRLQVSTLVWNGRPYPMIHRGF